MTIPWWGYVILAGLSWGTYVPIIFYGGTELAAPKSPLGGRFASILCVGVAYFVMAVVIPLVMMQLRDDVQPEWKANGLIFSGLAGVMGAVGAICVIFASKAAVDAAKVDYDKQEMVLKAAVEKGPDPTAAAQELKDFQAEKSKYLASYRIYIAPLIFCLAPMINTVMSLFWHPKPGHPWHFGFDIPSWHLPMGIVLIAGGVFLVLYSKEAAEAAKGGAKPATPAPAPVTPPATANG